MEAENEALEKRLNSFVKQLQFESQVFERLIYKNKNQHRRGSYFQRLLKVRRELRLFQSTKLDQILNCCFQVIDGKKPKQKLHFLECLNTTMSNSGTPNYMERLLGVGRLLSQMVEPILAAAIEVSILLARTFFMGFCLTIMALLSRIRVLVQQMLLDVVKVFNMVFAISRQKQSIKIMDSGIEIFRDYYPGKNPLCSLDCKWITDKYVLCEQMLETDEKNNVDCADANISKPAPQYFSIESFLPNDDDPGTQETNGEETCEAECFGTKLHDSSGIPGFLGEPSEVIEPDVRVAGSGSKLQDNCSAISNSLICEMTVSNTLKFAEESLLADSVSTSDLTPMSREAVNHSHEAVVKSIKRSLPQAPVFVPVKKLCTTPVASENMEFPLPSDQAVKEDSIFAMLSGEEGPSFFSLPYEIGRGLGLSGVDSFQNRYRENTKNHWYLVEKKRGRSLLFFLESWDTQRSSFRPCYRYLGVSDGVEDESSAEIRFADAVSLFNGREFFKCHDLLEVLWMEAEEPSRTLFHGILQCAVGFYHLLNANHKGAMMELGEGLCKLRKLGFDHGPFHQFEQDIAAVLEFIYQTQIELAACTDGLCVTMDGSESSYDLLGGFAAGQPIYFLQDDGDGVTHIVFCSQQSSLTSIAPVKVKLPLLAATEKDILCMRYS